MGSTFDSSSSHQAKHPKEAAREIASYVARMLRERVSGIKLGSNENEGSASAPDYPY